MIIKGCKNWIRELCCVRRGVGSGDIVSWRVIWLVCYEKRLKKYVVNFIEIRIVMLFNFKNFFFGV